MTEPNLPSRVQDAEIQAPKDKLALISRGFELNKKTITALLGDSMEYPRFIAMLLSHVKASPELLKCSPSSLIFGGIRIARMRLSPDPALGMAWLIPRKGHAEFQIGYKGVLNLAYRSPLIAAVRYGVVRKGDEFLWVDGRDWQLKHIPGPEGWPTSPDETVAAWAILELRSGAAIPRVMWTPEILRHKGRGAGSQPAWKTDFAAMSVKTVLGEVCRRGPLGDEASYALNLDHRGEVGLGQPRGADAIEAELVDPDAKEPESKAQAFAETFGGPSEAEVDKAFADVEAGDDSQDDLGF